MAQVKFYVGKADKHIAVLDDGAVPRKGEFINIKKTTYKVERVTWAVDHADRRVLGASLRANVVLSES